ncbi:hypothetical protein MMG85_15540 [Pseudoxanthomonas sp. LH2527]|nr:hypothetical protein [Pseudoxanthomonas sp. LH2527]MCH6484964.1 hypothetical protein [Pseudoxanthomonas sp. LH2527]
MPSSQRKLGPILIFLSTSPGEEEKSTIKINVDPGFRRDDDQDRGVSP